LAPEEELALLKAAAAAGITPEPLRMDRATGALLLRYAPGAKGLAETAAREPANIARIAGLLRRLHAMPAMLRDYAPLRHAEHYFAAAARRASLTRREQEMAAELRTLASSYSARYPPCAVCHNDLVAANILDAGELLLIDFEYAARAAPILDLASLAAMNGYDENERGELLRAYYGSSAPPVTPAELTEVVRMVELMAYFWARALPPELGAQNARYLRVC
jgi:thiamine kinase-like enzyme